MKRHVSSAVAPLLFVVWIGSGAAISPASAGCDVAAASAGTRHSLVLRSNGTVWAWGENIYGQLGSGSTSDIDVPSRVLTLGDVEAIAAGGWHSLALKSDGTVWAW